jgi:tetratricopeptide (TPR) repeat protein
MEVDRDRVAQMLRRIRGSPYGPDALPIHPAVGRYFGIKFATESYRYEQRPEGRFTFREYAERYVRFIWNPPLAAGIAAFHLGDLDTARAQVAEGLRRSPGSADGHATMSHILAADGQIEQAVAEARTATELEPAAVRLHVHLGQVLDRLGNGSEAEYAFERAIALAPEDPAGHIALSHLMFHQRRFDEALEAALRAIELEPEVADFHAHLGHIYAWREQPREAIGAMRTASELAPDRAAYHDWLSDLLERAGDRDGAIISARAAIALGASDHGRQQRLDRLCAAEPA